MSEIEVNYHILPSIIVISYQGKIKNIPRDGELGVKVISHIKNQELHLIPELLDIGMRISQASPDKEWEVIDGEVYSFGVPLPPFMSDKILRFLEEDLPFDILIKFWNNLKLNPSERARQELYQFLETHHFPLSPDGCFIAYKKVTKDFKDCHSKTFDNSPGKTVSMPREKVTDDRNVTCAPGLHIASYEYAQRFTGDILLEVKVNPRDVVSIPNESNCSKCRVCEYYVMGPISSPYQVGAIPKTEATPSSDSIEKQAINAHESSFFVGKVGYRTQPITEKEFRTSVVGHKKICRYDQATIFKTRESEEVWRKKLDNGSYSYYEKKDGKFYRLEIV